MSEDFDWADGPRKPRRKQSSAGLLLVVLVLGVAGLVTAGVAAYLLFGSSAPPPPTTEHPPTSQQQAPQPKVEKEPESPPIKSTFLADPEPKVSDSARITAPRKFERHNGLVQSVALSPGQRRFLSAGAGGAIEWDLSNGRSFVRRQFRTPASAAVYLPGGRQLVCADEGTVVVLDQAGNEVKATIKYPRGNLQSLAAASDGKHVVTGGSDGGIRSWNLAASREDGSVELGDLSVLSVAASPKGMRVAAGCSDGSVGVWEFPSGKKLWQMKAHAGAVPGVAFSPDGSRVASAGLDGSIVVWNAENGTRTGKLSGHPEGELCVAFLNGGNGLVSGGRDGALRFWNLYANQLVRRLPMPAPVHALALAQDDSFVVAGGAGGMLQLTPIPQLDLEEIIAEAAPAQKLALPDPAAVEAAVKKLHQGMAAADPEESQVMADRWLARAGAKADPVTRLALFRSALDSFVRSGRLTPALKAVDEMARWFEIDRLKVTADVLAAAAKTVAVAGQGEVIEQSLKLLPQADAGMRPDIADALVATVTQAAERSKSAALEKRVAALKRERERLARERGRLAELEAKLKADAADRDANLEFGLMLAARDNWKDALTHIRKGADLNLAKLAEKDLAEPKDGKTRADLGQGWHEAAAKNKDWKAVCLTRSKYWYEQAQAVLAGEEKSRVVLKLGMVSAELSDLKERQP